MKADDVYLLRGEEQIGSDGVAYDKLMQDYKLEKYYEEMQKTELPSTYHHLLRGFTSECSITNTSSKTGKSNLMELVNSVPFDRPIQPLSMQVLRSALRLPAASKPGISVNRVKEKDGTDKMKAKTDVEEKEKKERKRKKREREDAVMLQKILAPLIMELRSVTWSKWIVHGKPSNPFLQKITRDNCKRLGVPTYFEFIEEPMDLTRMKEKVERAEYTKVDQFSQDIRLLVKNATTFNRAGEPVHHMALELEKLCTMKLSAYQSTLDELHQERKKRKKEKKKKKEKKRER